MKYQEILPKWDDISLFKNITPIDALKNIKEILDNYSGEKVHPEAIIHEGAKITNSIIGKNVEIFEGVTVRDSIILEGTTIGHASEIARAIVLPNCFIPRFNYVGGSILGKNVNLGGLTSLATRRHDNKTVQISWGNELIDSKCWKFGSIIGDDSTLAYSVHVNPGTIVGRHSLIMPYIDLKGFIPPNSLIYIKQEKVITKNRSIPDINKI